MEIDAKTALYGVIGNPVAHSLSPDIHNRAFAACGINAVYLAFCVADPAAAAAAVRSLAIRGVSVTLPHKVAIMDHLDEIDAAAKAAGAANTIVNRNGRLKGTNTDGAGALAALREAVDDVSGRRVAVLGAGGAARAVVHAAIREGARVTVVNRTESRGMRLARDLGASFCAMESFSRLAWDVLVNATPVGMTPDIASLPVPEECLRQGAVVMDIVYNPRKTQLIRRAEKRGCTVITGDSMFVHQGALQFKFLTGIAAPVDAMRDAAARALARADGRSR